jgi:hypothetical protein
MKLHRVLGLIVAAQLLAIGTAWGQGSYKAEAIGAAPAADLSAPLGKLLDSAGARVANDQGVMLCEVWLRKTLPTTSSPNPASDVLYGTLTPGSLVGVLHFPAAATDFRGQVIKAGYYTLRYVLIPQDGNHMGVNPYRDAVVLAPVAADQNPDQVLTFDDLVKLGRQASGTAHPGLLVAAQPSGSPFPSVTKDDQGHWNVQVKGHGQSGDIPLALTVVGKWEG